MVSKQEDIYHAWERGCHLVIANSEAAHCPGVRVRVIVDFYYLESAELLRGFAKSQ